MVAALSPDRFLAGEPGCGDPLVDVELRLAADGALEVRTDRLALGCWRAAQPERWEPLRDGDGWWRSGDQAALTPGLQIAGRIDGAIHSGGETVFPEQLEARLRQKLVTNNLPSIPVLMLAEPDPEWGERLVALVGSADPALIVSLQQLTTSWLSAERPKRWLRCPELSPNAIGKWERKIWQQWLVRESHCHD